MTDVSPNVYGLGHLNSKLQFNIYAYVLYFIIIFVLWFNVILTFNLLDAEDLAVARAEDERNNLIQNCKKRCDRTVYVVFFIKLI